MHTYILYSCSSEPRRLGARGRTPRRVQARVPEVPEAVHQLRRGAVPRQAHRYLAQLAADDHLTTKSLHILLQYIS